MGYKVQTWFDLMQGMFLNLYYSFICFWNEQNIVVDNCLSMKNYWALNMCIYIF